MDLFWKTIAGTLIGVVLAAQFINTEKHIGILLKLFLCVMGMAVIVTLLRPIIDFLQELEELGDLRNDILMVLLKASGLGITSEIAANACMDAGSPALNKMITLLGTAAILSVSIPVFRTLLELIQQIAGVT